MTPLQTRGDRWLDFRLLALQQCQPFAKVTLGKDYARALDVRETASPHHPR